MRRRVRRKRQSRFGLAVAIIFVYYIVMTDLSYVGDALSGSAWLWAWMPNLIFTVIGSRA